GLGDVRQGHPAVGQEGGDGSRGGYEHVRRERLLCDRRGRAHACGTTGSGTPCAAVAARRVGILLRRRTRFLRSTLHFGLAAKDGAPILMLGHWHSALDADAYSRLWRLVSTQKSFQK